MLNIQPNLFITALIADHMVMKRPLPDDLWGTMRPNPFRHRHLILPDHNGKIHFFVSISCHNKDRMHMIGHDHILIDPNRRKELRNFQKMRPGIFSESIQLTWFSENTFLVVGTDRNKVVVRRRIAVSRNSWAFSFGKFRSIPHFPGAAVISGFGRVTDPPLHFSP